MTQICLLTVGDMGSGTSSIVKYGKDNNMKVMTADSVEGAITTLCGTRVEMVFASVDLDLARFFTLYNESRLNTPVVVAGPASKVKNAVAAIRMGAIEYLSTPVEDSLLAELLKNVKPQQSGPIYGDERTHSLLQAAKKFAVSNATILLRGESGTGKEVFSKFVHANSTRSSAPFVSINCAAIPENLLESELFGHEKGAFSGAITRRLGKFQQAHGGTLLLDEISEMDLALQAKLLRAIQERVIDPVGATDPVEVDIRLIATTNRDLEKEVEKGTFREDLYFRLNVVALELPPLRERPGDILPLSRHFAQVYGQQNGIESVTLSPEAEAVLTGCYWKGNVRELENTIHRAVLMMTDGTMRPEHIVISSMSRGRSAQAAALMAEAETQQPPAPAVAAPPPPAPSFGAAGAYAAASSGYEGAKITKPANPMVGRSVQDVEKELILSTLDYCGGNRTHAANILGISIRTLRNKLKEYGEDAGADDEPEAQAQGA
jgi:DNA-binding NtrC family response regulator